MAETLDVKVCTVALPNTATDWQGDDVIAHLMKAPSAAYGGAIKILRAYAINQAATTGGTSFDLTLLNYGTAGTAVGGTVAAAIGGTADHWAAGTPKAWTISDGKLEADEWLVVSKNETNSADPTRCTVVVEYIAGV